MIAHTIAVVAVVASPRPRARLIGRVAEADTALPRFPDGSQLAHRNGS